MAETPPRPRRSFAELTLAYFGRPMTIDETFRLLESDKFAPVDADDETPSLADAVWVGSVGYEHHKLNDGFAEHLRRAGVERLVDVREAPISRRRGYAKTALSDALGRVGIEYVHLRALGNPKPYRDLFKAGQVSEGRRLYERLLREERHDALQELAGLLHDKRTALMCVEHDRKSCHRAVILDALHDDLGLELQVVDLD